MQIYSNRYRGFLSMFYILHGPNPGHFSSVKVLFFGWKNADLIAQHMILQGYQFRLVVSAESKSSIWTSSFPTPGLGFWWLQIVDFSIFSVCMTYMVAHQRHAYCDGLQMLGVDDWKPNMVRQLVSFN
jgi:hypothetical protein